MKQNISNLVYAPAEESGMGAGSGGVSGTLSQAKQSVTQTARDTASKIKSTASETASRAKEEAQRIAQQKKEMAATRVSGYGNALHRSAEAFEQEDPNIAWFTHQAAERIDRVADYLRNRDFSALRHDAEDVARRHPAAFFGGMFIAGLVLGNILTATRRKSEGEWDETAGSSDWAENLNQGGVQTESDYPGASAAGI